MAPDVAGRDPTDPRIKVQFSIAQAAIVSPGLDFIVRAYQTRQIAGPLVTAYPLRISSDA